MKIFFTLIFIWFSQTLISQEIDPGILSSTGYEHKSNSLFVQWTLGELLIDQKKSAALQLDEGFHQLLKEDVNTAVSNMNIDAELSLFPNPAIDELTVRIGNLRSYQYSIVGFDGKMYGSGNIIGEIILDISNLLPAGYLIEIQSDSNERGYYSFVKI